MAPVIVAIAGIVASRRTLAIEQDPERRDRIADVDSAIVVAVTSGETGIIKNDHRGVDEGGCVSLAATGGRPNRGATLRI